MRDEFVVILFALLIGGLFLGAAKILGSEHEEAMDCQKRGGVMVSQGQHGAVCVKEFK